MEDPPLKKGVAGRPGDFLFEHSRYNNPMPDTAHYSPPLPDFSPWLVSAFHWLVDSFPAVVSFLKAFYGFLVGISIPLSVFFIIGIVYCVEGLKRIRKKEAQIHDLKVEPAFDAVETGDTVMAHRWENATRHVESDNPNDWKQGIIEADIILDDLLTKLGYKGESIGDKLKRVNPGDMKSLNEAWEAHKVRNQIAHEPGFALNQIEAKRVIGMYRKVFEEFYYI